MFFITFSNPVRSSVENTIRHRNLEWTINPSTFVFCLHWVTAKRLKATNCCYSILNVLFNLTILLQTQHCNINKWITVGFKSWNSATRRRRLEVKSGNKTTLKPVSLIWRPPSYIQGNPQPLVMLVGDCSSSLLKCSIFYCKCSLFNGIQLTVS